MKKSHFSKIGMGCLAASMILVANVQAADLASASDKLAEIAANVVEAKFKLAQAANSGNVAASAKAAEYAKAADSAMAEARRAFAAMETAFLGGDFDAADSAFEDIAAAGDKIAAMLGGEAPLERQGGGAEKGEGPAKKGKGKVAGQKVNPDANPFVSPGLGRINAGVNDVGRDASGNNPEDGAGTPTQNGAGGGIGGGVGDAAGDDGVVTPT